MNWREAYRTINDVYRRSDILRAVLAVSRSAQEISDIVVLMETLPEGLQSHIAWDVVNKPHTTIEIYERVKCNLYLLSMTDVETIQSTWQRNHHA